MRPPKYPLAPLHRLRGRQVDEGVGELADATRTTESAERARVAAEQTRDVHLRAAARVEERETRALDGGHLRAADLAAAALWGRRVGAEAVALTAQVDGACARERDARLAEKRSREQLSLRRRDAEVVDKHRQKWDQTQRRNVEAREEDAALEVWRPKP